MQAMSFNFAFAQKENKSFATWKIKAQAYANKYAHYNSEVYKKLTTLVLNSTQSYFPYYSTVTSAYQGSVLVLAPLLFLER